MICILLSTTDKLRFFSYFKPIFISHSFSFIDETQSFWVKKDKGLIIYCVVNKALCICVFLCPYTPQGQNSGPVWCQIYSGSVTKVGNLNQRDLMFYDEQ